jgi:hypothetical protein
MSEADSELTASTTGDPGSAGRQQTGEDGDCILWVDGAGDDYFLDLNNPTDVMTAIKLIGLQ